MYVMSKLLESQLSNSIADLINALFFVPKTLPVKVVKAKGSEETETKTWKSPDVHH